MKYYIILITLIITASCVQPSATNENTEKSVSAEVETNSHELKEESKETVETASVVDENKCNINNVLFIKNNIDKLKNEYIYTFLYGFDEICKNNVEYSQFSNEVLFMVLDHYPQEVINCLNEKKDLKKSVIINELTSPINDLIDVKSIYKKIESIDTAHPEKDEILVALKEAIEKYN